MSEAVKERSAFTERARQFLQGADGHLGPLLDSVEKSKGLLGPLDVADHLQERIDELGLAPALEHFREHGYAAIEDVAPPEEMDELREAIHSLAEAPPVPGVGMRSAPFLLGRHPAVDRIATNPKILAFAEVSVGNGLRASQFAGSVMYKSDADLPGVHADQNWLPAPFPEHNCVITFCIPCEGMTTEEGATRVVPGSGAKRRHPRPEEIGSETVPIEVKKGGVAVWNGSVWHGSGVRRVDGTRTVLHATYQRLYTQPIDDYTYLLEDEEYMASAPEAMRGLLGENLFFGTAKPGSMVDMRKFGEA
ncbi:MAG: phytanoyl-CoA dioxygenase family protein, partial [Gammaproteobacteria bacterium]|nr:phytanoyl-CoA dioxygenase family protein [Gammaproteobacteria bacterium]